MEARLFLPEGPRVWTLPAGAPFLRTLAKALAEAVGLNDRPDALADAIIYVPNRRSARALALELYSAVGQDRGLLLPDIRALGDLETDEAPPGTDAAFADLGPALPEARRLGVLMRLVRAWFELRDLAIPPQAALATARNLASLLDAAAIAGGVDWSQLPKLVENADLAQHWQHSVRFLEIVTADWPAWLGENRALDPLARRLAAARAIAANWQATPPAGPIVIAGSTGATPASRILMQAACLAPRGAVILPGLDTRLDASDARDMAKVPSHPQFALLRTLDAFALAPGDIPVLAGQSEAPGEARRALIHESLSPAELTGDWRGRLQRLSGDRSPEDFARAGLSGLDLIAAENETEEATIAACMMREALETPGRTVALVSPDAGLSRRVSALLARWDIDVAPSEGIALLQLEPGMAFDALLDWWCEPADPVKIAALLHAPFVARPAGAEGFERHGLRGACWWRDLDQLCTELPARLDALREAERPDRDELARLLDACDWLRRGYETLASDGAVPAEDFRARLRAAIATLFEAERLWAGEGGAMLARQIEDLVQMAEHFGPLDPEDWLALWRELAAGATVPPGRDGHPRLHIWGLLEARLQTADHFILAGLNEDVWPRRPGADAFLPAHFRSRLGMEHPEALMGLAAHDFAGLACAPRVTLLYSKRRDDAPAVASRWVWRLQTLARGALGGALDQVLSPPPEKDPRVWARALETPLREHAAQHARPRPKPPVEHRPNGLSVTRIDTLQRDPYAIYAERVLGLSPLDPLGKPVDARETGTAIHAALERFEDQPQTGTEGLLDLLVAELRKAGEPEESLAGRRAILRTMADWYVGWHAGRQSGLRKVYTETRGSLEIAREGLPAFRLSAVADRVEIREGGAIAILDFKTGAPPTDKEIDVGLSQQMPLQGLIARAGGFADVPAGEVTELVYVSVRARPEERKVGPGKTLQASPMELAERAEAGLKRLLAAYGRAEQPYLSAPRAQFVKYEGNYGRLARRAEWTSEVEDG